MALNIGSLYITFDANTQALQQAQRRIETFAQNVRAAYAGIGKGTVDPSFANSLNRQEQQIIRFARQISDLQSKIRSLRLTPQGAAEAEATMTRLGQSFNNFSRAMTQSGINANEFSRRTSQMSIAMQGAQRSIGTLASVAQRAPSTSGWSSFTKGLLGLGSASLLVQGHFGGMSTRLFGFAGIIRELGPLIGLTTAGIVGLGAAIVALGEHSIKVGIDMQSMALTFNAISSTSAEAAHDINFVHDVAMQAGVSFVTLANSYGRFLAAARESGQTLDTAQKEFKGLTLAGATLHLTNQQLSNAFLALQEMLSKGTVATQQLRRQLGSEIPGAFAIAAKAMKVTETQLVDLLKKGMIPAAEFVPKFVAELEKAYKIDPNKNIETFRASLGRLSTTWFDLGRTIGQQTGVLTTFASTIDRLTSALNFIGAHFTTLVAIIGAVTGAAVGLGIAFLGIQFAGMIASITSLTAVLNLLFDAIEAISATTLVGLALAITGAIIGFNLFKNAVTQTADQVSNSFTPIEEYIKHQEAMGNQVKDVTVDLQNQTKAIMNNAAAMAAQANAQLMAAQKSGVSAMDVFGSVASTVGGAFHGSAGASPERMRQGRIDDLRQQVNQWSQVWRRAQADMQGLSDVSKLPDELGRTQDEAAKAAKGLEGITNKVKDLQDAARGAAEALQAVFTGLKTGQTPGQAEEAAKALEDAAKAREITNNLKGAQLAAAAAQLGVAANTGAVNAALTELITKTRQAKEVWSEIMKVWEDVAKTQNELAGATTQLNAMLSAGDSPQQQRFLENLTKAQEQIRTLTEQAQAGFPGAAEALRLLYENLEKSGYGGRDAAEAIADMNTQLQNTQDAIKIVDQMSKEFQKLEDSISNTVTELQGLKAGFSDVVGGKLGNLANFAFGPELDQALQDAITRGQTVKNVLREIQDQTGQTFAPEQITNFSNSYLDLLRSVDMYKQDLAEVQKQEQRNAEAVNSWVQDGLNGIKDFLDGTKNLKTALLDLAKSFLNTDWQTFIVGPAQDFLGKLGRGLANRQTKGIDTQVATDTTNALQNLTQELGLTSDSVGGKFLNSILGAAAGGTTQQSASIRAATGLLAVSTAAAQAAASLGALSASAALGSGSSTGGIFSSVLGSIFKTGMNWGSVDMSSAMDFSGLTLPTAPFARGGNMTAGQLYSINEPGTNGEYFIPRVNGYMSPNAPGGGGGTVMIDASVKYVDARGATPDAIAQLDRTMQERESRLRKQLPYLIDARVIDSSRRNRFG